MGVPELFAQESDQLERLEKEAERRATTPLRKPLRRVLAMLYALWPGDDAPRLSKQAALARLNTDALLRPLPQVERELMVGALRALTQGIAEAGAQANVQLPAPKVVPDSMAADVRAVRVAMATQHSKAQAVLDQAQTKQQAEAALVLMSNVNKAAVNARWLTNRAANEGIAMVAAADPKLVTIWRAERDACRHCLAYQGQVRRRGKYPAGLTFGDKPLKQRGVLRMPPLHPNCRCTQWVVSEEVAQPVIEALLREAKRSILRGYSLESESEKARLAAADKLLKKGSTLPASVKTYARRSVKLGGFKRGRKFPGAR